MKIKIFAAIIVAVFVAVSFSTTNVQAEGRVDGVLPNFSAGSEHTMAIRSDGSLWGWGRNHRGQLGDGTTTDRATPVRIMDNVIAVSAYYHNTLAIRSDGSLWGWGIDFSSTPVKIMENVTGFSDNGRMAIRPNGIWNVGSSQRRPRIVRELGYVISFSTSAGNNMAIRSDGSLLAWGRFGNGLILDDGSTFRGSTTPVRIMEDIIAVSLADEGHGMIIRSDGSLWGFGANLHGELGTGTTRGSNIPIRIMDNVVAVSAISGGSGIMGSRHTMALRSDGSLWAWGGTTRFAPNDFSNVDVPPPVKIMDNVAELSPEGMVTRTDGTLWAWERLNFQNPPTQLLDNVMLPNATANFTPTQPTQQSNNQQLQTETISLHLQPDTVTINYNNNNITLTLSSFELYGIRYYPVLDALTAFGGNVIYNESQQTLTLRLSSTVIVVYLNDATITVNGIRHTMPTFPILVDGIVFMPMEVFNLANVQFNYTPNETFAETFFVELDGERHYLSMPVIRINNEYLYPYREIAEIMGATVRWDAQNAIASAALDSNFSSFLIGSNQYNDNGTVRNMVDGVRSVIIFDRTYLPIRYIVEPLTGLRLRQNATQNNQPATRGMPNNAVDGLIFE
ncbi:MAG: stalk domain-containing protein [Firmicutes bacterium]|nr:stalk domain-containing protein [Bacillota bacterium]